MAERIISQSPKAGRRKRVTLFSDGWDTTNSNPTQVAERLKRSGVFIETVGYGAKRTDVDEATLRAIASTHREVVQYRFFSDPAQLVTHLTKTGVTRVDY